MPQISEELIRAAQQYQMRLAVFNATLARVKKHYDGSTEPAWVIDKDLKTARAELQRAGDTFFALLSAEGVNDSI